jgi:hypothetical protein
MATDEHLTENTGNKPETVFFSGLFCYRLVASELYQKSPCSQNSSEKEAVFCFGSRIMNKKELDRFEEILDRFGASVAKLLETTEQMKKAVDEMIESSQKLIEYYDEKKKIERKP